MATTIEATLSRAPKTRALAVQNDPEPAAVERKWYEKLIFVGPAIQGLSRRQFEGRLSKLVNSALAHEQEGLPPTSDAYIRLNRMADESIDLYCKKNGVDRLDLEAQIPAVNKLRALATARKPEIPFFLRPSTFVLSGIAGIIVSALLGLDVGVFHWAASLIHHH